MENLVQVRIALKYNIQYLVEKAIKT